MSMQCLSLARNFTIVCLVFALLFQAGCIPNVNDVITEYHTLTVNISPAGKGTVTPNGGSFADGDKILLDAVSAANGWKFTRWEGDSVGVRSSTLITMDGDKTVTAVFEPNDPVHVTLTTEGQGTVDFPQTVYNKGEKATLEATPAAGWTFARWTIGGSTFTDNPINFQWDQDEQVTCVFVEQKSLTVNVSGQGTVAKDPSADKFDPNSTVKLTAIPANEDWRFDHWAGDLTGTANPATVTMDNNKNITAVFSESAVALNVTLDGFGSVSYSPAGGSYKYGDSVTLTAVPGTGWHFAQWKEGTTTLGTATDLQITMNGDRNVVAVFELDKPYTLTLTSQGQGTVSPASGTQYNDGSLVTLTATPSAGWHFARWQEGSTTLGTATSLQITMSSDRAIVAIFEQDAAKYTLTLKAVGNGGFNPASGTQYNAGTSVNLVAIPAIGWTFVRWEGDASGTAGSINLTMNANKTVTGVFVEQVALTVNVEGQGSVAKSPGASKYDPNSTVTLTATPATDWMLDHWAGDASGNANPLDVTMTAAKTITAVFVYKYPQVVMETSMGNITLRLNREKAPITVANFLQYVNEGFFDGTDGTFSGEHTIFHRVIPGFMIQGGGFVATAIDPNTGNMTNMEEKGTHAPIVLETTNISGLLNVRGTIAMARTADPNSATCQFFINTVDNAFLNYSSASNPGYAVFGEVISGMDIVDNISGVATHSLDVTGDGYPDHQNVPLLPIYITKVTLQPPP